MYSVDTCYRFSLQEKIISAASFQITRFEHIEMRKPNIPGKRPWKPDAVILFEDQEGIDRFLS